MSLLAVAPATAVLVLAWDETTPAVRALVEATEAAEPALDSVVVLVPAGPATAALTQEEFLPLASSLPAEEALPPAPADLSTVDATEPAQPATEPALASSPNTLPEPPEVSAVAEALALTSVATSTPAPAELTFTTPQLASSQGLVAAPPSGPALRILRLSEYNLSALADFAHQDLPAPTWVGAAQVPEVPYLGSLVPATLPAPPLPVGDLATLSATALLLPPASGQAPAAEAVLPAVEELAAPASITALPAYLPAELPAALDAEPDTAPAPVLAEPLPTADASTTEQREEAADELTELFAVDVTPVQAGWFEALVSLQAPAAVAETEAQLTHAPTLAAPAADTPTEVAATAPAYAALLPAASRFDAPNLNFQIIQYARFAVPLALAEQPFAVLYAPAWPTWLAAQELRQRTGLPLVLHVASLAAAEDTLELAAGWVAEIQRQALHRADLILTETPALAHRLRRELALPLHRVRPVPAADAAAIAQALSTAQVQQR